jgi:hypothetical protein
MQLVEENKKRLEKRWFGCQERKEKKERERREENMSSYGEKKQSSSTKTERRGKMEEGAPAKEVDQRKEHHVFSGTV